jgi:cytochrome c oxidase subunit IV
MIFEFTEEDLRSNQRGFITSSQKKWLEMFAKGIVNSHRGGWPIIIFFLLLGSGLILTMNLSNESTRRAFFADPILLVVLCTTVFVVLGIYGLSAIFAGRRAKRLADPELKIAEGVIRLDEDHSRVGTTYYVFVGNVEFKFGIDMSRSFPERRRCRVYYCETSMLKAVLSYELMN